MIDIVEPIVPQRPIEEAPKVGQNGKYDMIQYAIYITSFTVFCIIYLGLHVGSKNAGKISIIFDDLWRNSVFFWTEVKPY